MRMTLTNDDEETSHWSSSLHLLVVDCNQIKCSFFAEMLKICPCITSFRCAIIFA